MQTKASNADMVRTETLTFRLSKQLRSLAEVGARQKGVKLANFVETALQASLSVPEIYLGGTSILANADVLYDEDDAICFIRRLRHLWAMSPEQKRLLDLIRASKVLYPSWGRYDTSLIRRYWTELCAVRDGADDLRALPPELFDGVDAEFALMSEAERIALYQKNPGECARRTEAYLRQTMREKPEEQFGKDAPTGIQSTST